MYGDTVEIWETPGELRCVSPSSRQMLGVASCPPTIGRRIEREIDESKSGYLHPNQRLGSGEAGPRAVPEIVRLRQNYERTSL
jgi:hypothetical protein